jgi:hypothetical protein
LSSRLDDADYSARIASPRANPRNEKIPAVKRGPSDRRDEDPTLIHRLASDESDEGDGLEGVQQHGGDEQDPKPDHGQIEEGADQDGHGRGSARGERPTVGLKEAPCNSG